MVHELILMAYYRLRMEESFQKQDGQKPVKNGYKMSLFVAGKQKKTQEKNKKLALGYPVLVHFYISQRRNFKNKGGCLQDGRTFWKMGRKECKS